jgi:hypothetical protein
MRVISQSFIALCAMLLLVSIRIMKYPDNKPLQIIEYRMYYSRLLVTQKSLNVKVLMTHETMIKPLQYCYVSC